MTEEMTFLPSDDALARMVDRPGLALILGETLIRTLTGMHGEAEALAWAKAITSSTLPGTTERKTQDELWTRLTYRLALVGKKKEGGA